MHILLFLYSRTWSSPTISCSTYNDDECRHHRRCRPWLIFSLAPARPSFLVIVLANYDSDLNHLSLIRFNSTFPSVIIWLPVTGTHSFPSYIAPGSADWSYRLSSFIQFRLFVFYSDSLLSFLAAISLLFPCIPWSCWNIERPSWSIPRFS